MEEQVVFERTALEFDEIHRLVEASIIKAGEEMPEDEEQLKKKPEDDIIEDLLDILILAYTRGNRDTNAMLGTSIKADMKKMDEAIYWIIGGETFEDRARKHIRDADPGRLIELAESEYHRVYEFGGYDTAEASGKKISKRWVTMLDDKVRATHDFLEGVSVPMTEKFYTFDGDSARFPGDFEKAENNCQCRCVLWYTASA